MAFTNPAIWGEHRGNRVSPPAVSLSNRTPPCGEAPGSLPQRGRAREGAVLQRVSPALERAFWDAEGKWVNEWETNKRMRKVCLR